MAGTSSERMPNFPAMETTLPKLSVTLPPPAPNFASSPAAVAPRAAANLTSSSPCARKKVFDSQGMGKEPR